MPTAIIKPSSVASPGSWYGVTAPANALSQNDSGATFQWQIGETGNILAAYNTDATTVLPTGAIITNWKIRYRYARTASSTNVYPLIQYNAGTSTITVADYIITSGWTNYTIPDPAGAFPDGYAISTLNTPSDFSVFRIGGRLLSASGNVASLYLDYFEIDVIYTVPSADANIHLLMGDF